AEDGIRDFHVTGVQTCALPICEERCDSQASGGAAPGFDVAVHVEVKAPRALLGPSGNAELAGLLGWDAPIAAQTDASRPLHVLKIGRASCRESAENQVATGGDK